MVALLDPRLWLAVVIWTAVVAFLGYQQGASHERKAAERRELKASNEALQVKLDEDARIRDEQRRLIRILDNRHEKYAQEEVNAKAKTDRLIADLRAGNKRMFVPVAGPDCQAAEAGSAEVASGTGGERRAELAPVAGEFLVRLADRGDAAIRKHAEVVDRYELLRQTCMGELP